MQNDLNRNMVDNNNVERIEFKEDIYNIHKDNKGINENKENDLILSQNKNKENIENKQINEQESHIVGNDKNTELKENKKRFN